MSSSTPFSPELQRSLDRLGERIESIETVGHSDEDSWRLVHERISRLESEIISIVNSAAPPKPDRAPLYTALAEAHKEIQNADKNVDNEFLKTKYADLASCLEAVRGPLADNGLAIIQLTEDPGEGVLGIRTILTHSSGATITDLITMSPPKLDPQGIGQCRTYMRRYSLMAVCAISGSDDLDGEGLKEDPNDYERVTVAETEQILMKADEVFGERADAAIKKMLSRVFGVARVADIRAGEAEVALTNLQNAGDLMKKNAEAAAKVEKDLAAKEKSDKKKADADADEK